MNITFLANHVDITERKIQSWFCAMQKMMCINIQIYTYICIPNHGDGFFHKTTAHINRLHQQKHCPCLKKMQTICMVCQKENIFWTGKLIFLYQKNLKIQPKNNLHGRSLIVLWQKFLVNFYSTIETSIKLLHKQKFGSSFNETSSMTIEV